MSKTIGVDRRSVLKAMGVAGAVGVAGSTSATAAGPTAVIDADPLPVESGETLTFDGSRSSGDIDTYEWYYRNWQYSSDWLSSPSAAGQTASESFGDSPWGVKLVVTDSNGNTDSTVMNVLVRPEGSVTPVAEIEKPPTDAEVHAFSGRDSYAPRGSIQSYEWYYRNWDYNQSFLDSPSATGPDFNERFGSGSHWKIKLVVTNENGRTGERIVDFYP